MISIIIPCKNRLNHLAKTYTLTRRLHGEYEVIIVDYNCPMGTADYLEGVFKDSNLSFVRAGVGDKEWNLSHARNLGSLQAKGDVFLFIDADTILHPNFLKEHVLNTTEFLSGTWLHASGCCMVWKKDFESVRGYNEVVGGWGTEDYNLYKRLVSSGLRQVHFKEKLYKNMSHPDTIRNEYHGNKNIHVSNQENYEATEKEFKSCLP
ncbi:MAG: glycosyltransferase [Nitrososphaerales archaeon]